MTEARLIDRLADEFFAAIERADMDALAAMYTPDAVLWHNSDNREQPHTENTAMLRSLWQGFKTFKYRNVRRQLLESGFVQQHDTELVTLQGERFTMRCCMVVSVRMAKIARIDEYLDSAQMPQSGRAAIAGG
jgi:ketosteroid isomerase-like protein